VLLAADDEHPPIPTAASFSEVNVRTYVTGPNGPWCGSTRHRGSARSPPGRPARFDEFLTRPTIGGSGLVLNGIDDPWLGVGRGVNTTRERLNPVAAGRAAVRRPLVKVKLLFLLASFISLVLSVSLYFGHNEQQGIFVGIWVPSILSLGALLLAGENGEAR